MANSYTSISGKPPLTLSSLPATPKSLLPTTPKSRSRSNSEAVVTEVTRSVMDSKQQTTPPATPRQRRFSFFTPSKSTTPTSKRRSSFIGWMISSPATPSNKQKTPLMQEPQDLHGPVISPPLENLFAGMAVLEEEPHATNVELLRVDEFMDDFAPPYLERSPSSYFPSEDEQKEQRELQRLSRYAKFNTNVNQNAINQFGSPQKSTTQLSLPKKPSSNLLKAELPPIIYSQLAQKILTHQASVKKVFKQVVTKFQAYDNELNSANITKYKSPEARLQAITAVAKECLVMMKNYQVFYKEKQFLEDKNMDLDYENGVFNLQFQRMIEHIESHHPLHINLKWSKKLQLLGELQQAQFALNDANSRDDDIERLTQISTLIKHACSYEKIYGDHAIMKKVRIIIGNNLNKLQESAQKDLRAFYTAFGNNSIIDLAFSGDSLCDDIHKSICKQLNTDTASENHRFLDRLQKILMELQTAYLEGSILKKMSKLLQEINAIYNLYISAPPEGAFVTQTSPEKPVTETLNLTADERRSITMAHAELNAKCISGKIDQEEFYQKASTVFLTAQVSTKKIIQDSLKRLKDRDLKLPQPEFLPKFLKSIASR